MNSSVLYPPSFTRFGDDVIRKVVLRERLPSRTLSTQDDEEPILSRPKAASSAPVLKDTRTQLYKKSPTPTGTRKRQSSPLDEAGELELRRSRCRANMQRYRNKLRSHAVNLEEDVLQLRGDIQKLQLHHDTTLASAKENTAWSVAAEYFRLFGYGLKGGFSSSEPGYSGSNAQLGFLCANVAPDVVGSTGCGVKRLREDFRQLTLSSISQYFPPTSRDGAERVYHRYHKS